MEGFLVRLCEPAPLGLGIFDTRQKALMFAAALGYYRKKREPLKQRGEGIRVDVFQRDADDTFIEALGVAVRDDLNILRNDRTDERLQIFEEHAYAGLLEMQRLMEVDDTAPLDKLVALTQEAQSATASEIPGVDASVLALMR
jgi:dnd system-associated protein 4